MLVSPCGQEILVSLKTFSELYNVLQLLLTTPTTKHLCLSLSTSLPGHATCIGESCHILFAGDDDDSAPNASAPAPAPALDLLLLVIGAYDGHGSIFSLDLLHRPSKITTTSRNNTNTTHQPFVKTQVDKLRNKKRKRQETREQFRVSFHLPPLSFLPLRRRDSGGTHRLAISARQVISSKLGELIEREGTKRRRERVASRRICVGLLGIGR